MPEPIKQDGGTPESSKEVKAPTVEELQSQIANLNKGIAKYRDEAQQARDEAKAAKQAVEKIASDEDDDDEDLELTKEDQKKLEVWAKKKGLVTKEEFETERNRLYTNSIKSMESQAVSEFLEKYPEYDTDNKWEEVLKLYNEYKTPSSLQGFRTILGKIHKELTGGKTKEDAKAEAKAEIHTRSRLGLGRGATGGVSENDTVETLRQKYPNLSKDQIEARMSEIKSLYPEKDKK